ncbi:MAG: AMP-binding protein [Halioglobus sp.]
MANHASYYEAMLGAVLAGVWLAPVNSHLTAPEIEYVMADSGARVLFTDREEVEGVLLEHPEVADVAVIGVDDKEWGRRVHAYIQPIAEHEDGFGLLESLREFAGQRLAKFKVPRSMELIEQLPRFDSGKLYLNRLPPPDSGHWQDS